MTYSGSIQWAYRPDEETIKKAKKRQIFTGLAIFAGVVFIGYADFKEAIENYSHGNLSGNASVYIIIFYLIFMFISIRKHTILNDETFAMNNGYLEIINEKNRQNKAI